MRPSLNAAFLLVITMCASYCVADDYGRFFGPEWHVTSTPDGKQTLLWTADYPCYVKAVGWRLLASERRKGDDSPWYSIGDRWLKWGFKIVVTNAVDKPVQVWVRGQLKSEDGFSLDSIRLGEPPLARPGESAPGAGFYGNAYADLQRAAESLRRAYPPAGSEPADLRLAAGGTEAFQTASWYNTETQKGEGDPGSVDYKVGCEEIP